MFRILTSYDWPAIRLILDDQARYQLFMTSLVVSLKALHEHGLVITGARLVIAPRHEAVSKQVVQQPEAAGGEAVRGVAGGGQRAGAMTGRADHRMKRVV